MNTWDQLAEEAVIVKTVTALKANGIEARIVATGVEAKEEVLAMLPKGAEVMTMSSVTLETIGLVQEINESGKYDAVKPKLSAMDRKTRGAEMRKIGAAPDWAIGSVQAVSEDGHLLIASNTGSQLPAYAYGSGNVIWVVGTQKIVRTLDEGMKRIYEYVMPLEDVHMHTLYGVGTAVNKVLIINKEFMPNRAMVIFVKERLGY